MFSATLLVCIIFFLVRATYPTQIMQGLSMSMLTSSGHPSRMDCCLCNPALSILGPPRSNSVCASCLENAKRILTLSQKLGESNLPDEAADIERSRGLSQKGLTQAFNQIQQFHDAVVEKLKFVEALTVAFREGIEPDVQLVPRDGPSIHAHRVVMATKSSVFRNMFEGDGLQSGSIPMPDMNHDQLKCLVEFLYSGCIPEEKIRQHGYALFVAADKYAIPLLSKICEAHISGSVNPSNVLEILDLAAVCSATALKETAINAILKHRDEVIFSNKYERFAVKSPLLSVEITKALLRDTKSRGPVQVGSLEKPFCPGGLQVYSIGGLQMHSMQ